LSSAQLPAESASSEQGEEAEEKRIARELGISLASIKLEANSRDKHYYRDSKDGKSDPHLRVVSFQKSAPFSFDEGKAPSKMKTLAARNITPQNVVTRNTTTSQNLFLSG